MSQLIVNFPDCAELGSNDPGDRGAERTGQDTITVYTENCPAAQTYEGPPPLVPWWAWVIGAVVMLAFIAAVAVVRTRRHERLETERTAELKAQIELAQNTKVCRGCGGVYDPVGRPS